MMRMKSAVMALTAGLCAVSMSATAEAKNFGGGHMGGHIGHMGHMGGHYAHVGHGGHWGHGHHHHGWYGPGFGIYAPYYSSYYDDDDYGDCYRVYRNHHWRTVCD